MSSKPVLFADRRTAGRQLAQALQRHASADPIVLALPRGGVPVAFEVAEALGAPLDLVFVRKIGAPGHPEYGVGAVVDGIDPQLVVNPIAQELGITGAYIDAQAERELQEIERRRQAYVGGRKPEPVRGRTVIVIDDGIATGITVRAALQGIRKAGAGRIILAVPVAAPDTIESLRGVADEIICLATPEPFHAVGPYYGDFTQTSDAEVISLLEQSRQKRFAETNR